jgi:hypothetical protein
MTISIFTACFAAMVDIGSGARRELQEYWLNEEQALAPLTRGLWYVQHPTDGLTRSWECPSEQGRP